MIIDCEHLYKQETGECPGHDIELEFEIWRSKGQWIVEITDEEKFHLWGNRGAIVITKPDEDYIKWLEEKVIDLLTKNE